MRAGQEAEVKMRRSHLLAGVVGVGLFAGAVQSMAMTAPAPVVPAAAVQVAASSYDLAYSVRNVQQLLNQLGYDAGTPDGSMGFKTHTAIRAFQKDANLPISGEVSPALFQRL